MIQLTSVVSCADETHCITDTEGLLIRSYGTAGRFPVPHWYNYKMTWANIVNIVLDFGTKKVMLLMMRVHTGTVT